jgi:hypothetical protein
VKKRVSHCMIVFITHCISKKSFPFVVIFHRDSIYADSDDSAKRTTHKGRRFPLNWVNRTNFTEVAMWHSQYVFNFLLSFLALSNACKSVGLLVTLVTVIKHLH